MALLCGGGGETTEEAEQKKLNKEILKDTAKEQDQEAKIIKMLLLGAGESGKSTIFKQMKIINKDGYSEAERKAFVGIVHSNAVSSMVNLMAAFEKLEVALPDDLSALNDEFGRYSEDEKLDETIGALVCKMWNHAKTQEIFERKSEYQLNDSADYYFKDIERISAGSYIPTEQDVLRSRVRTTGIVQTDFKIKGLDFAMFDVGGQRNERRKWIHAFDNVHAVIFVAALSEYDQVLYEDETQNRMEEAISLFDQIVNSRWFADTSMILFLNKKDLFEMKLKKAKLSAHFSDYNGDDLNFDQAAAFFKDKFLEKCKNKDKSIYPHITCATDTKNVSFVFNAVIGIILEIQMKGSGLM